MMNTIKIILIFLLFPFFQAFSQQNELEIKQKKYKTLDKSIVQGEVGFLTVPENRQNPDSRKIKIKFIRLKSLAKNPEAPVIYLEGGGSACTWQAESPKDLSDWLPILQVSDLIFVDQRGTTDKKLTHIWKGELPSEFMVSEDAAATHYQKLCKDALVYSEENGIDYAGYNIVAHAKDMQAIATALKIEKYSIFGFSFGTHIGMAMMKLFPDNIANAVLIGADAPNQSFNYPFYFDSHFKKVAALAAKDATVNQTVLDLNLLLEKVMKKLKEEPVLVTVKNPLNGKKTAVKIGTFGLSLILRLDIDDVYDIPAIPRLLYSIDQGDYSMLTWFVQKRIVFAYGVPINGINQALASGASEERWEKIEKQAKESQFGNVVNFPFYDAKAVWPENPLAFDAAEPLTSNIRTLFVTGNLDCRTPAEQVNETSKGFSNFTHLVVKNAGHENAMWNIKIFDEVIPKFLRGEEVRDAKVSLRKIKFLPLTGASDGHPSIK